MPRTKGSKNRPKINTTKDYASQIAEEQKNTLKEKKSALKKAEAEAVLKKLLSSGMSVDEILEKLK